MAEELKSRKEIPEELTWDLSHIYATEEDMFRDAEKMEQMAGEIVEKYRGHLDTPERIEACVTAYRQVYELMMLTGSYCDLAVSVDYYDNYNQERNGKISRLIARLQSSLSFVKSEIMEQEEAVIRKAMEDSQGNRHFLQNILRDKPHRLHPEAERVVSALSQSIYGTPYEVYNIAKLADMKFDPFVGEGVSPGIYPF